MGPFLITVSIGCKSPPWLIGAVNFSTRTHGAGGADGLPVFMARVPERVESRRVETRLQVLTEDSGVVSRGIGGS